MMFDTVKEIILEFAEPECEIEESSKLRSDLGLSSFDMVCMVDRLCEITHTDMTEKQIRQCVTVGDLCRVFGDAASKGESA